MNQSTHCTEPALPAAPLFASSWAALFLLIRAQFSQREPVRNEGAARKETRVH